MTDTDQRAQLRAFRLDRIRRGEVQPRPHCPEEMAAYSRGKNDRRSLYAALLTVFVMVVVGQWLFTSKSPPAVKSVALGGSVKR